MSGNRPKADWYPDPSDPSKLRYWDGSAWTAHSAPSPQDAPTPSVTVADDPTASLPAPERTFDSDGQVAPTAEGRRGWVLPVAVVVLLAVFAASLFFGFGLGDNDNAQTIPLLDGGELWRVDSPPFGSGPLVLQWADGAVVLVGAEDCGEDCDRQLITVVDPDDGSLLWSTALDAGTAVQVGGIKGWVVGDLLLIDPNSRGPSELIAFDLRSGREEWQADMGANSIPKQFREFGDLIVIEGPTATDLLALDIETGTTEWTYEFPEHDAARIETTGPGVLVVRRYSDDLDTRFELQGLDAQGTILWEEPIGSPIGPLLEISPPDDASIRISRDDGKVRAFDLATGKVTWEYRLVGLDERKSVVAVDYEQGRVTMTALKDNVITVATVDLSSGDELWTERLVMDSQSDFAGDPAVISWTESVALVADSDVFGGPLRIVAIDLADGSRLWDTTIGDRAYGVTHGPVLDGLRVDPFSLRAAQVYIASTNVDGNSRVDLETGEIVDIVGERTTELSIDDDQLLRIELGEDFSSFQVVGSDSVIELGPNGRALSYINGVLYLVDDDEIVAVG